MVEYLLNHMPLLDLLDLGQRGSQVQAEGPCAAVDLLVLLSVKLNLTGNERRLEGLLRELVDLLYLLETDFGHVQTHFGLSS